MTNVAVLGSGIAGLLAAHSAIVNDANVDLYIDQMAAASESRIATPPYLSSEPFGTGIEPAPLRIGSWGSEPYDYAAWAVKFHGLQDPFDWPGDQPRLNPRAIVPIWGLAAVSDAIRKRVRPNIIEVRNIDARFLVGQLPISNYDYIFNTLDADRLCIRDHTFAANEYHASHGFAANLPCPDNTILLASGDNPSWSRLTNMFGGKYIEWGVDARKPPIPDIHSKLQPAHNNCSCWSDFIRIGPAAQWSRDGQLETIFKDVQSVLFGTADPALFRFHPAPCPLGDEALSIDTRSQMGCKCA